MGVFSFVTHFFLLAAFILLLLVSLSVPIIKTIDLLKLSVNVSSSLLDSGVNGTFRFGVWGYCVGGFKSSVLGIDHISGGQCTKAKLGYKVPDVIDSIKLTNVIIHGLTFVLVLHPIACGLAFLALLLSLAISFNHPSFSSRFAALLTLGTTILAALVTTAVFIIDIVLVVEARHKVKKETGSHAGVTWGNAVWMALAAAVLLWVATVGACAGIFACGHRRKHHATY